MIEPAPVGLPAGYGLRRPLLDDADEVAALIVAVDVAATGETTASRDDLLSEWGQARFDLAGHAWLVVNADGRAIAYAWVFDSADHAAVDGQFLVHPDHQWRGLEGPLLDWVERRAAVFAAAAPAGAEVTLGVWCSRGDRRAELYRAAGYAHTRSFLRLRLTLDQLPDDPLAYAPPPGLEVRRFVAGNDERAAWATLEDSFADHFRESPMPFEEWRSLALGAGADTDLWFTAWDGDEMAGCIVCYAETYGGYVDRLGVRRPWRRRGLGRLLLLTAFAALRDRGCAEAILGVDADNRSGALGLYESLGMRRSITNDFYEKAMEPRF